MTTMMTVDEKINYLNQLGVHFDSNTLKLKYSQNTYLKCCPKLFYDKQTNEFALFYQSPNNNEMGQQAFYFDELHFLEAYNEKKYKNYTSKKTYKTFDEIFFTSYYPYAEPLVRLIFELFDVNPTTLNKAFNMQTATHHKKNNCRAKRRQPLKLKEAKTIKNVFAPVMATNNFSQPIHNVSCGHQKIHQNQNQNNVNNNNHLNDLNEQLIQKYAALAAKHFDVATYFALYLRQYCTLNNISQTTQNSKKFQTAVVKNVLMKKFCNLVDKLQYSML